LVAVGRSTNKHSLEYLAHKKSELKRPAFFPVGQAKLFTENNTRDQAFRQQCHPVCESLFDHPAADFQVGPANPSPYLSHPQREDSAEGARPPRFFLFLESRSAEDD
jgi:hypothetical protein